MTKEEVLASAGSITLETANEQSLTVCKGLLDQLKVSWKYIQLTGIGGVDTFFEECGKADSIWRAYAERANEVLGFYAMNADKFMDVVKKIFLYDDLRKVVNNERLKNRSGKSSKRF